MGPECPFCHKIYEWTVGELTEVVYSPRTYFCAKCYGIFTVDAETLAELQVKYAPNVQERWEDENREDEEEDTYESE